VTRKHYIDNLRWMSVLLLFPYHIFMIYNPWGENFYVKGPELHAPLTFNVVTWPWFMPLLFAVAGISTAYAMRKRSVGAYIKERVLKLLVPLAAGILLVIPAQTYYAERYHNGYTGGYFAQYVLFFTKPTDLTGYAGGFTPGHLWFILYLFAISLVAVPVMLLNKRCKLDRFDFGKLPLPAIVLLVILPLAGSLVLDIAGKSLGEYFAWFLLGYFVLSSENVQAKLEKRRFWLLGFGLACLALEVLWWFDIAILPIPGIFYGIFDRLYGWVIILALMGLGRRYLNISNRFTRYMSRSSFSVYVFHQTWVIAAAFYVFRLTDNAPAQMGLILLASVIATFVSFEICRRIPVTRFLFAVKK
jgi:hypothetical protein